MVRYFENVVFVSNRKAGYAHCAPAFGFAVRQSKMTLFERKGVGEKAGREVGLEDFSKLQNTQAKASDKHLRTGWPIFVLTQLCRSFELNSGFGGPEGSGNWSATPFLCPVSGIKRDNEPAQDH